MPGLWKTEQNLRRDGFSYIAGLDEAGCGPIAGPVVAAAVIFTGIRRLPGLTDSKFTTLSTRERLFPLIQEKALTFGIGIIDARTVDRVNIYAAARLAMAAALRQLNPTPDLLLVDGYGIQGTGIPQRAIVKGDRTCACIAAASILAKVTRDRIMQELDALHPGYGFAQHKGYGTREHLLRLRKLGPCPEHRRTFAPVRDLEQGCLSEDWR